MKGNSKPKRKKPKPGYTWGAAAPLFHAERSIPMPPIHLQIVPRAKRMNRKRRISMGGLETLDRIRGLTYTLSALARAEDHGSLKNLAVGVLERALSGECDSLREMVRREPVRLPTHHTLRERS
jgi:hypothetical protein